MMGFVSVMQASFLLGTTILLVHRPQTPSYTLFVTRSERGSMYHVLSYHSGNLIVSCDSLASNVELYVLINA